MDIAVLGSEEFVLGFRLGGVKRVYAVKPEEYEEKFLELIADPRSACWRSIQLT